MSELPFKMWQDEYRRCWTIAVPDVFGVMSPVLNAVGEPETVVYEEASAAPSSEAWRLTMNRIIGSCTRISLPRCPSKAPGDDGK